MDLNVSVKAESVLAALSQAPARFQDALVRVVTRFGIALQAAVKVRKLSGQVLHVRTGTLRRSINSQVFDQRGEVYGKVGTNVVYAGVHEYGFTGTVSVAGHTRRLKARPGSDPGSARSDVWVQTYSRRMDVPARSYLRSTLGEMALEFRTLVKGAALESLR